MSADERYYRWLGSYFFAAGYDREDLVQEARIAAWLAPSGLGRVAAKRRVLDVVKAAQRRPRLYELVEAEAPGTVEDVVVMRERLREVIASVRNDSEREALRRVFRGEPLEVGRDGKALSVALARFRQRLAA